MCRKTCLLGCVILSLVRHCDPRNLALAFSCTWSLPTPKYSDFFIQLSNSRLWVCLRSHGPSLGHIDDAEQRHVDDGDFVLVAAAFTARGGVEAVRLVLAESGMSSNQSVVNNIPDDCACLRKHKEKTLSLRKTIPQTESRNLGPAYVEL